MYRRVLPLLLTAVLLLSGCTAGMCRSMKRPRMFRTGSLSYGLTEK